MGPMLVLFVPEFPDNHASELHFSSSCPFPWSFLAVPENQTALPKAHLCLSQYFRGLCRQACYVEVDCGLHLRVLAGRI